MHTDESGLGFLVFFGTGFLLFWCGVGLLAGLVLRRSVLTRAAAGVGLVALAGYAVALVGVAQASHETILAIGEEKHICEVDCHVAYAVTDVRTAATLGSGAGAATGSGRFWVVSVRARFDPTTTSPRRPRGAPVTSGPRIVEVREAAGGRFGPSAAGAAALASVEGATGVLTDPLLLGASRITTLVFDLPADVRAPRLLIEDAAPIRRIAVGHEGSFGHAKMLFALTERT